MDDQISGPQGEFEMQDLLLEDSYRLVDHVVHTGKWLLFFSLLLEYII